MTSVPTSRLSRLRVIQPDNVTEPKQDCGGCRNKPQCWMPGITEELVLTNLLVCRIKRGVEVDKSTELFLKMVRPALRNFAKSAIRGVNIDPDVALKDFESKTIEYLQTKYVMTDRAYPLHFLFGKHKGWIRKYALNYATKTREFEETHYLQKDDFTNEGEFVGTSELEAAYYVDQPEEEETDLTRMARQVIDDGLTLSLQEYRVMKFCMQNAHDAKRPLNGLHVYLARVTGMPRAKVTKIYADAQKKVVSETKACL